LLSYQRMAKAKVNFKPLRIAEGDWNILAECPGVEPVHIRAFKQDRNRRLDERRTPHRLAALRVTRSSLAASRANPGNTGNGWPTAKTTRMTHFGHRDNLSSSRLSFESEGTTRFEGIVGAAAALGNSVG
jgi:hypothetical protein